MHSSLEKKPVALIRGGGDLASGVAVCLARAGYRVAVAELAAPLVVRRKVSFAQAIFDGACQVEDVTGKRVSSPVEADQWMGTGHVAVMIDPDLACIHSFNLSALVDGRMIKSFSDQRIDAAPLVIGLGPGFTAGVNCHAAIETKRGANLGKVYWQGGAEDDSGIPEPVMGYGLERVLYAPASGVLSAAADIGDVVEAGAQVASVDGRPVFARFRGVVRGLIQDGMVVERGVKIGDIDPRCDVSLCFRVSDKALVIGAGVLEALRKSCEPTGANG